MHIGQIPQSHISAEKPNATGVKPADSRPAAVAAQAPQQTTTQNGTAPPALHKLLASLGLPQDKLSASIVSCARFFSLPLEAGLLAKIRRQAFSVPEQPKAAAKGAQVQAAAQANREALSLAAAAATSKGVELAAPALERYAAALDPSAPAPAGEDASKAALSPTDPDGGQSSNQQDFQDRQQKQQQDSPPPYLSGTELKNALANTAEQSPLLAALNRLPGRDGQRWLVFPFSFEEGGQRYRVSLRVLLDEGNGESGSVSLEILRLPEKQRWLFTLAKNLAAAAGSGKQRLTVSLYPHRSKRAAQALAKRLASYMGMAEDCIFIQNGDESSFFTAEIRNNTLPSVNEAV